MDAFFLRGLKYGTPRSLVPLSPCPFVPLSPVLYPSCAVGICGCGTSSVIAHPNVSTSPTLIELRSGRNPATPAPAPACAGAVSSRIPANAITAPTKAFQRGACPPGGRRPGTADNSGTSTTISPVMNADLDGVVRARPSVWNWYPVARQIPTTAPDTTCHRRMPLQ